MKENFTSLANWVCRKETWAAWKSDYFTEEKGRSSTEPMK